MKLKNALMEGNGRFGQFNVNDIKEIIPNYEKELQQFLNKNSCGKLFGISSMGNLQKGYLTIIGESGAVTIDMNTMKPMIVSAIQRK